MKTSVASSLLFFFAAPSAHADNVGGSVTLRNGGDGSAEPAFICNAGIKHRENGGTPEARFTPLGDMLRYHMEGEWKVIRTRSSGVYDEISKEHDADLDDDPMLLLGSERYGAQYFFDVCFPRQAGEGGDRYTANVQSTDFALGNTGYLQKADVWLSVKAQEGDCTLLGSTAPSAFTGQLLKFEWTLKRSKSCVMRFEFSEKSDAERTFQRQGARVVMAITMPERKIDPTPKPK